MNLTFYRSIGSPREINVDHCESYRHVFRPESPRCICGQQTFQFAQEHNVKHCDCGNVASEFKGGSPVCDRCSQIEKRSLYNTTHESEGCNQDRKLRLAF